MTGATTEPGARSAAALSKEAGVGTEYKKPVSCSPTLSIFFGKKLTKVSVDSVVENFLCGGKGKKKRKTMKRKVEEEAAA